VVWNTVSEVADRPEQPNPVTAAQIDRLNPSMSKSDVIEMLGEPTSLVAYEGQTCLNYVSEISEGNSPEDLVGANDSAYLVCLQGGTVNRVVNKESGEETMYAVEPKCGQPGGSCIQQGKASVR
jgi:outer membrane protein assembly factor BamE (lipoprotein component of BamABCDE complex)